MSSENSTILYDTHIDAAIGLFQNILLFAPDTYGDVIWEFARDNNILTKDDVDAFMELFLRVRMDDDIYYTIDETNKIKLSDKSVKGLKKINRTDIQKQIKLSFKSWGPEKYYAEAAETIKYIKSKSEKDKTDFKSDTEDVKFHLISQFESQQINDTYHLFVGYCYMRCTKLVKVEFLKKLNLQLWFHFVKSLLNAEYLIVDQYIDKLNKVEDIFLKYRNFSGEQYPVIFLYPIESFVKLAWYAKEAYFMIKAFIQSPNANIVDVHTDRDIRFNNLIPFSDKFEGKKETIGYERFVKSVIDMTIIDHCYETTPSNFEKLIFLLEYGKALNVNKEIPTYNPGEESKFKLVAKMVEAKMATLLHTMLIQTDKQNQKNGSYQKNKLVIDHTYIINGRVGPDSLKAELNEWCIKEDAVLSNHFLSIMHYKKNQTIQYDEVINGQLLYDGYKRAIADYDRSVNKGIKKYCEFSHFFELSYQDKLDFANIKYFTENCDYRGRTPSFYVKAIGHLYGLTVTSIQEEKKNALNNKITNVKCIEEIKESIDLLEKLLKELYAYVQKHDQLPTQYRPLFLSSFYRYSATEGVSFNAELNIHEVESYNCEKFEDLFFFASINCTPINLNYLKHFFERYDTELRKLTAEYDAYYRLHLKQEFQQIKNLIDDKTEEIETKQTAIKDFQTELKESQNKSQKDLTTAQENLKTKINDDLQSQNSYILSYINDWVAKVNKDLKSQHNHTVTVLGIFAAFLSFVSVSIGMAKIANNMLEYIIFCAAFTVALSVFVLLIKFFFGIETSDEPKPKWKGALIIILIGIIIILSTCLANKYWKEKIKNLDTGLPININNHVSTPANSHPDTLNIKLTTPQPQSSTPTNKAQTQKPAPK